MLRRRRTLAIGLISGGLDSALAAAVLQSLDVEVRGIHFSTGFCKIDHRRAMNDPREDPARLRNPALRVGALLGFPVEVVDVAGPFLDLAKNPRHGYGANVNPCLDCRIFMLSGARRIMAAAAADLVFTGEVLGQRPMSQHKRALRLVEAESGLVGHLLRPLSAALLEPTIAEQEGRLDRSRLLAMVGRTRRPQLALARDLGLGEQAQPSGGCCYLVDPHFARRFRDLLRHPLPSVKESDAVTLLKVGRHFRLAAHLKLITGRNERENCFLERFAAGRWRYQTAAGDGTLALCLGEPEGEEETLVAGIAARYSRQREQREVDVVARGGAGIRLLRVRPAAAELVVRLQL